MKWLKQQSARTAASNDTPSNGVNTAITFTGKATMSKCPCGSEMFREYYDQQQKLTHEPASRCIHCGFAWGVKA